MSTLVLICHINFSRGFLLVAFLIYLLCYLQFCFSTLTEIRLLNVLQASASFPKKIMCTKLSYIFVTSVKFISFLNVQILHFVFFPVTLKILTKVSSGSFHLHKTFTFSSIYPDLWVYIGVRV